MIVQCESCNTKFRLDPARIKGAGSKVRCSRCRHIFYVVKEEYVSIDQDFAEPRTEEFAAASEPQQPQSGPARIPAAIPRQKKRSKTGRYLVWGLLILGVAAVMGGGALWLSGRQSLVPSSSTTPVEAGKTMPRTPEKGAITILDNVQAYFLENESIGQIFVVQGEVRNDSVKPVSFILLEGKLFTTDNKVYQNQKFYCANIMSRENLTRQTMAQIQDRMMNREGKDLLNVHIPSKAKVPFMAVFHNLPGLNQLSDYSIEVVSSEID